MSVNPLQNTTEQDKVVSLFQFIQELNKLRQKTILSLEKYPWFLALSDLHDDPENINVNYRDWVEEENPDISSTLLSVRKPEFQKCPTPEKSIEKWLKPGWDDYKNEPTARDTLEEKVPSSNTVHSFLGQESIGDSNDNPEHFEDDEKRVIAYNSWKEKRAIWVEKQKTIEKTRAVFSELYQYYFELQKESETEEIIVANGILYDRDSQAGSEIKHPILTHRVKLSFDPDQNIVSIEDTDAPSELYTIVFQKMEGINLSVINQMSEDLQQNDYHPLDRNDTLDYLKILAHQLSYDCEFSEEGVPENWKQHARFLLLNSPCYIVRKRLDGTVRAIEQIIENIQQTGEIPAPIGDIVSGGKVDISEDAEEETVEEQLAAVGGESIDILLSKEANKEQLEIAKRIEYYNAVLVQGPPGTGKTHTIANLMGHFLAQGKNVLVTSHTTKALSVLKEKVATGLQNLCVSVLEDSNVDMERSIDGITDYMSKATSHELKKEMDMLAAERRDIIAKLAAVRRRIFSIINQESDSIVLNGEAISPSQAAEFVCNHAEDLSYIPGYVKPRVPLPLTFEQITDLYMSNEGISENDEAELKCRIPHPDALLSPVNYAQTWEALQTALRQRESISADKEWITKNYPEDSLIRITGSFGEFEMPYPGEKNIEELKSFASSFGKIGKWMNCVAVDGHIGGAYRQRWTMLTKKIQETCSFAESIVTERFGKKIEFRVDDISSLEEVYTKMKATFAEKGKLSRLTLAFHKDYEIALEQVSINGNPVASVGDCDIVLNEITLKDLRGQCESYWDELLAPNGVPKFEELDSLFPENIAANWIPQIDRYLDWYKTDYQPLLDLLALNQIPAKTVFEITDLDSDLTKTEKILNAIENTIPYICDICTTVLKERDMTSEIASTKRSLTSGERGGSKVCRDLYSAADRGDSIAYTEAYAALEELYAKYDLQSKRGELLNTLEAFAPAWANAIRMRIGIHGESIAPANIEDAWKWKQLSGILEEITAHPYAELQAESLRLSKEYRETTAKYAEKSGWFYLLSRTETDINMRQALQGWRQTVKRIGKGTGKRAPALKAKARELMADCQAAVPCWIMTINRALESLNPKKNRFDIVIIDEASQADISSLAILYMGKKFIIVGDDKQVSPMAVGVEVDKMTALEQMYIKDKLKYSHLFNEKASIYDIAATTFQPLMLREHFRCVPEIIGFSNMLSYDYKIKPLRDASTNTLLPAVINYRVADGKREGMTNLNEAKTIVSLIKSCIEQPEYAGKSFGVISLLGDQQATEIQKLLSAEIDGKEIAQRNIICGNSATFQGDERNVVFLSLVDSGNADEKGPLRLQGFGVDDAFRKRYNVAASRAKDQLWVVHSLDPARDLQSGDLRKTLIDYSMNPQAIELKNKEIEAHAESPFESEVAKTLSIRGYHLVQQWEVGAYRLDIVAVCGKKTVAIECDGERWHSGEAKIRADMERQTILERLGWRFIRIRGSEFYRNKEKTIERVVAELQDFGIEPEEVVEQNIPDRNTDLLQRVKISAAAIYEKIVSGHPKTDQATVASALNPKTVISEHESKLLPQNPKEREQIHVVKVPKFSYSTPKTSRRKLTVDKLLEHANEKQTEVKPVGDIPDSPITMKTKAMEKKTAGISDQKLASTNSTQGKVLTKGMRSDAFITELNSLGIEVIDNRTNSNIVWIPYSKEQAEYIEQIISKYKFKAKLEKRGAIATNNRPAWRVMV